MWVTWGHKWNRSECSKLTKRNTRVDITRLTRQEHWELCKRFKFDLCTKWNIQIWIYSWKWVRDVKVQTYDLIPARRLDLLLISNYQFGFVIFQQQIETKRKRKDKRIFWLCQKTKTLRNIRFTDVNWCFAFEMVTQIFAKWLKDLKFRGWMKNIQSKTY